MQLGENLTRNGLNICTQRIVSVLILQRLLAAPDLSSCHRTYTYVRVNPRCRVNPFGLTRTLWCIWQCIYARMHVYIHTNYILWFCLPALPSPTFIKEDSSPGLRKDSIDSQKELRSVEYIWVNTSNGAFTILLYVYHIVVVLLGDATHAALSIFFYFQEKISIPGLTSG